MTLILTACGPQTLADVRYEGEAEVKRLVSILREVENKEDLVKASPLLKKRFARIAELLVEAKKLPAEEMGPSVVSEQLFIELARLYEIAGCREIIEQSQGEAIRRCQGSFHLKTDAFRR